MTDDIVDKDPWPTWEDEIRGLVNEIDRLKKKCDFQVKILQSLTPDKHPGILFIHGTLGTKDENNMPEKLMVVPAYGVDFSYIYERTDKIIGGGW
jgi:hypothetical protein